MYGDGKNIRDWLYVEDHAEAIILVANKGLVGERFCIGGNTEKTNKLRKLYDGYDAEIIITDPISSQLIKYLANTYLPMRLSFVNEATRLSDYSCLLYTSPSPRD